MPAITADQVIVELEAKVAEYNRKIAGAERNFDKSMKGIQGSAVRMTRGVSVSMVALAGAIGALGLVALGRQAVQTSLDFRRLEQAMAVATGSTEAAGAEFAFVRDLAERLGIRFLVLAETYTGLAAAARGTNLEGQRTREIFEAVSTAIVATGGSAQQAEGALLAVQQMISKGNVSAEELRGQLGERLPGAFQIAARAMGVTTGELDKMLQQGQVVADDFLPRFAQQLRSELPQSVETADASFQRFQTALDDIANSTADGFMDELSEGVDDLTATLKALESSGGMEAFGAFLGTIISMGSEAVRILGNLAAKIREAGKLSRLRLERNFAGQNTERGRLARQRIASIQGEFAKDAADEAVRLAQQLGASFIGGGTPVTAGTTGGGGVGGSGGGGGKPDKAAQRAAEKAAREAERARIEALRRAHAVQQEQLRADSDILRANLDTVENAETRAFLQESLLLLERQMEQAENELAVKLGERTQAEVDKLEIAQNTRLNLELQAIREEEIARKADEAARLQDERLRLGMDLLGVDGDLARTASERRAIELKLLDLAFERERVQLEALAADRTASDAARQAARERLAKLPTLQAGAEAGVRQRTMSPLEAYLDSIPQSAEEMNEALESVAARGLQSVTDGLTDAIVGAKSLGDVFKNVANQIIADLIRIAIQQAVVNAVAPGLGNLFGGFFADGGRPPMGKVSVVGERRPELFVPDQPGTIVPMGGNIRAVSGNVQMPRPQITVISAPQFDLRHAVTTPQLMREVDRVSKQNAAQAAAVMGQNVIKAVPGRMGQFSTDGT